MENLFQIHYDKKTNQSYAEYDSFVIRKVSKKQEEKLISLGQKYRTSERNRGMPRWLNLMNRFSFSATFTSFIFLIVSLFMNARDNKDNFIQEYLWLIIILSISIVIFIFSIILAILNKKKKKEHKADEVSHDLFNEILETSKKFLSIPNSAQSLEVLMEQHKDKKANEIKKYSNVILSVFIEKDMLCLADLYVVIGIPLQNLEGFDIVKETHRFAYWHKSKNVSDCKNFGVNYNAKHRCCQADQYAVLKMNYSNKKLGVFIPTYEVDEYKSILEEKRDKE